MADSFEQFWLGEGPPFDGLRDVAERFGVRIALVGGAATRVVIDMALRRPLQLVPAYCTFTDSLTVEHSGPDSQSSAIMVAIRQAVPFADWCRWHVRSESRGRGLRRRRALGLPAPLRSFRLSTHAPLRASPVALSDLNSGYVRPAAPPLETQSGYGLGQAPDLFRAIEMLAIASELHEADLEFEIDRDGFDDALARFRERDAALDPGVRSRLRFDLANLRARAEESLGPLLDEVVSAASLPGLDTATKLSPGTALLIHEPGLVRTRGPELLSLDRRVSDVLLELDCDLDDAFKIEGVSAPLRIGRSILRSRVEARSPEFLHLAWMGSAPIGGSAVLPATAEDPVASSVSDGGVFRNGISWTRLDISPALRAGLDSIRIGLLSLADPEPDREPDLWPITGLDPARDAEGVPVELEWGSQSSPATERILGRDMSADIPGQTSTSTALTRPRRIRIGEG